ncbi:MAG: transcription termination/antitermination protein NusG [Verrucomicrobiota bacterium]
MPEEIPNNEPETPTLSEEELESEDLDLSEELEEAAEEEPIPLSERAKGQWFALHVLSGQEKKVKDSIDKRLKAEEMTELIHEVVIPTERISEVKRGKKIETERRLYPGYVFVNMTLYRDDDTMEERSWYFVRETNGVIGWADGHEQPVPMPKVEVEAMLGQMREREDKVMPKVAFKLGEKVKVADGPFQSQEGIIEEIDNEANKLRVSVSMFGRSTPVDLEYWQVEKNQ